MRGLAYLLRQLEEGGREYGHNAPSCQFDGLTVDEEMSFINEGYV